jgi:hypothetical protein
MTTESYLDWHDRVILDPGRLYTLGRRRMNLEERLELTRRMLAEETRPQEALSLIVWAFRDYFDDYGPYEDVDRRRAAEDKEGA